MNKLKKLLTELNKEKRKVAKQIVKKAAPYFYNSGLRTPVDGVNLLNGSRSLKLAEMAEPFNAQGCGGDWDMEAYDMTHISEEGCVTEGLEQFGMAHLSTKYLIKLNKHVNKHGFRGKRPCTK